MWKNVMGSFAGAYFMDPETVGILVYLWGLCNGTARIGFGFLSDHFAAIDVVKYPRVGWLVLCNSLAFLSHISYFIAGEDVVWIVTIFTAISYGACYAIISAQMSFYFGTTAYAANMGIVSVAIAFGDLILVSISSSFVNAATNILSIDGECHGDICFFNTFILSSSCLGIALALSVVLMLRDVARSQRLGIKTAVLEPTGH